MSKISIEIIGILATILLVISMLIPLSQYKQRIVMRAINAIASILFITYADLTDTFSTWLSNGIILLVDLFYIMKEINQNKGDRT